MRSLALGAALTLLASNAVQVEARLFPRAVKGNGFLKVPVGAVDRSRQSNKRDEGNSILTVLDNMDFFYATDIEFGDPPQTVTVLVDTGSSELWVNPDCSTAPSLYQSQQCESFGFYDPDKSKTPPIGPFGRGQIKYGDPSDPTTHTSVNIQYYSDTISLGDATITNQTFGVVTSSDGQSQGIFGLAPDLEAGFDGDEPYSLVLHSMAEQGVIDSRVFALDLRHTEAETGAVIYGGIDRSKFIGNLQSMPVVRGQQGEYRLGVELDGMGITLNQSRGYDLQGSDRNVMLDSGTTISRMHYATARPILQALGAVDDGEGYYYVPCEMRETGGSVDFVFGNTTVRVPFRDFILDIDAPFCAVGMVITTDQQILGDSVLRAGYFVFDWDNEAVHIAQAANCGDDDIVAVGTGSNALGDVTGNCDEEDALFTGGPVPTATRTESEELPTGVYTTTYTITSCPPFDRACSTGLVTTQTMSGSAVTTQTSSSGDGNDNEGGGDGDSDGDGDGDGDGDDGAGAGEDAGVHGQALSLVLLAMGVLAGGMYNVL